MIINTCSGNDENYNNQTTSIPLIRSHHIPLRDTGILLVDSPGTDSPGTACIHQTVAVAGSRDRPDTRPSAAADHHNHSLAGGRNLGCYNLAGLHNLGNHSSGSRAAAAAVGTVHIGCLAHAPEHEGTKPKQ